MSDCNMDVPCGDTPNLCTSDKCEEKFDDENINTNKQFDVKTSDVEGRLQEDTEAPSEENKCSSHSVSQGHEKGKESDKNEEVHIGDVTPRRSSRKRVLRSPLMCDISETSSTASVEELTSDNDFCGDTYDRKTDSESASDSHTDLKCPVCGKVCKRLSNLTLHMKIHGEGGSYACGLCNDKFFRMRSLMRHIKTHQTGSDANCYECGACMRKFDSGKDLESHLKTCDDNLQKGRVERFECTKCRKCFPDIQHLNRHKREHRDVKAYKCAICGKGYSSNQYRQLHMISHENSDVKPYKCAICGQGFTSSRNRRRHMKSHERSKDDMSSQERPHVCDICKKGYHDNRTLRRHIKLHHVLCKDGSRPFNCGTCGKGFIEERNYTAHKMRHTGEMPCRCSICNKGFAQMRTLAAHLKCHGVKNDNVHSANEQSVIDEQVAVSKDGLRSLKDMQVLGCGEGKMKYNKCDVGCHDLVQRRNMDVPCRDTPNLCNSEECAEQFVDESINVNNQFDGKTFDAEGELPDNTDAHNGENECSSDSVSPKHEMGKDNDGNEEIHDHDDDDVTPQKSSQERVLRSPLMCDVSETAEEFTSNDVCGDTDDHKPDGDSHIDLKCPVCGKVCKRLSNLSVHMKIHGEGGPYACGLCNDKFFQMRSLVRHIETHQTGSDANCYVCGACMRKFDSGKDLKSHLKTCDDNLQKGRVERFECTKCRKFFPDSQHLNQHKREHRVWKVCKCAICGKGFSSNQSRQWHMKSHELSDVKPYKCAICGRGFTSNRNRKRHMKSHERSKDDMSSQERPHVCELCKKSYIDKSTLNRHIKLHHVLCKDGSRPFKCDTCGKGFIEERNYTAHMMRHTGETPYRCSICNKGFTHNGTLTMHLKCHSVKKESVKEKNVTDWKITVSKDGLYTCNLCTKVYNEKSSLIRHIQVHHCEGGKMKYKCDNCDLGFVERRIYTAHMLRHKGELPFVCSVCSKGYTNEKSLKQHLKIHGLQNNRLKDDPQPDLQAMTNSDGPLQSTGDRSESLQSGSDCSRSLQSISDRIKSLQCPICEKYFGEKRYLDSHILKHRGETPYKCAICGKGYTINAALKKHLNIHAGKGRKSRLNEDTEMGNYDKKFECDVCGMRFRTINHLRTHVRSHIEMPYTCEICDKGFLYRTRYQQHFAVHLNEMNGPAKAEFYQCAVCQKSFMSRRSLNQHMKMHNVLKISPSNIVE